MRYRAINAGQVDLRFGGIDRLDSEAGAVFPQDPDLLTFLQAERLGQA